MAEDYSDRPVSRASLMEIQEDRDVIEAGYKFLDEKLVLLAQELLVQLGAYENLLARFRGRQRAAFAALADAVGRHGLEGIQVYPPAPLTGARMGWNRQDFLGVPLLRSPGMKMEWEEAAREVPVRPSAEVDRCAASFGELTETAAELAVQGANLQRLLEEYRRTEQRARALDNVILPEVRRAEERMEAQLEEGEQEEAVRIRLFVGREGR